ncbi:hypothetical protein A5886_001050 [Enterococcus sp. 8G7_MSG3316]|uniref:4Fe-4S Mo/W bis-MGD-type domain-containing protein n=1 Tax=Candidatus Enterococcus testudinis TaxID=1834191 RepID=A0A242A4M4_9ENTE|nr:molybdopterin-dependent oxidoreductase [Enterococcus sp. 8G7_MSG3316]OTN75974.1 hypothetical protein A5886_001050 [Enterococcus sp. 8G7_MSG3316]
MDIIQTTCNYCALACNLDFHVKDHTILKVVPTKTYPVNKGFSCIKGLFLKQQQQVVQPPAKPLCRENGQQKEVAWTDAINQAAGQLLAIQKKYGPESIAGISTGQIPTEEMALFGHVLRNFLKGHLDGNTRLCMATSVVAYKQSFGFDAPPYSLSDIDASDTIILIGANPVVAHPVLWGRIRQNQHPNKTIIVIDPRPSETAHQADVHFAIKPKSDLVLFYILANVLIQKNWIDHDYIRNHTEGFNEFRTFTADYSLDQAEMTGLSKEQILSLAEMIHQGRNVSLWWTMGVNQGYEAVRTAQAIINIALMTGNIGRKGTGANSLTGQSNAMGSRLFSNTAGLYGGGDFDNPVRRKTVAEALGIQPHWLADKPTIPYNQIIEGINEGRIKALWVVATNPMHSWTDSDSFKLALAKLDLLIVQDLYADTRTAKEADIFFPVVSGLKKTGTFINTERRLSGLRPVLAKTAEEHTDYEVFLKMGHALGMKDLLNGWETPQSAFDLLKACTKGMPCDITGVEYDMLTGSSGIQWPFPKSNPDHETERRLYENGQYYTLSKKARFVFEKEKENPLKLSSDYPLMFNTGRGTVGQWHTETRTREIKEVREASDQQAVIWVHPDTAADLNIAHKEPVMLHSINGKSARFFVKVSPYVQVNELFSPMHYAEVNVLTPALYDDYSKEPSYKSTPVRLEKEQLI